MLAICTTYWNMCGIVITKLKVLLFLTVKTIQNYQIKKLQKVKAVASLRLILPFNLFSLHINKMIFLLNHLQYLFFLLYMSPKEITFLTSE